MMGCVLPDNDDYASRDPLLLNGKHLTSIYSLIC
nr:MAG TPA: hypothetical protein [Caudoviricetes sp.]